MWFNWGKTGLPGRVDVIYCISATRENFHFFQSWVRRQEHLWAKADRMRNGHVFGPMVHELFNEDLGNLTRQLKGPYGLQQLLPITSECTWRSQLRAVSAIVLLYGGYMPKYSENMQHQTLRVSSWSPTSNWTISPFFLSGGLQRLSCLKIGIDCHGNAF